MRDTLERMAYALQVRMTDAEAADLKKLAEDNRRSVSMMVRLLIEQAVGKAPLNGGWGSEEMRNRSI